MTYTIDDTAAALLMAGHSAAYATEPDAREVLGALAASEGGEASELVEALAVLAGAMLGIAATASRMEPTSMVPTASAIVRTYRNAVLGEGDA